MSREYQLKDPEIVRLDASESLRRSLLIRCEAALRLNKYLISDLQDALERYRAEDRRAREQPQLEAMEQEGDNVPM